METEFCEQLVATELTEEEIPVLEEEEIVIEGFASEDDEEARDSPINMDANEGALIDDNESQESEHVTNDDNNESEERDHSDDESAAGVDHVTGEEETPIEGLEGGDEEEKVGANEVYQWSAFTGLRVKTFSSEELQRFRKPFDLGWRREVVLRGTVTSSGKKIGDVYYFSADKKTKLRSYVEMGLYLKRSNSGLEPENFTFARQPIYRPPHEIVRHAMQRGGGSHQPTANQLIDSAPFTPQVEESALSGHVSDKSRSARNSTASESEEQFSMSIAEGRAKRKRAPPTRFEDEDYSENTPLKKSKGGRVVVGQTGQQQTTPSASSQIKQPLSLQEKRRQLQHQLLQQVHEQSMKKRELDGHTGQQQQQQNNMSIAQTQDTTAVESNGEQPIVDTIEETPEVKNEPKVSISARKSISASQIPKVPVVVMEIAIHEQKEEIKESKGETNNERESREPAVERQSEQTPGAPCSMHCPGRRGMLPNLMCSRCFCLYHLDCVPGGVFLEEPRVFVCPNCLKPEDKDKKGQQNGQQNGTGSDVDMDNCPPLMTKATQSLFVSSTPIVLQPLLKSRSTFAPILPKPPQLQNQHLFQQQQHLMNRRRDQRAPLTRAAQPPPPFNKNAAMNVRLPEGTHLYRVATGPNGHSMVVKDRSIRPKVKNARKSITAKVNGSNNGSVREFPIYKPAPIAPIAPIRLTPDQIHRQLRQMMARSGNKRRGYREWMEKRRTALHALLTPYHCLNQVLSYLTVADLVRLRLVSRDWLLLSQQPFLWRAVRLKGVSLIDWQFLAKNVIESDGSALLDFDQVKTSGDVTDFWRQFAQIVDYLKSVRTLRFGSVPTFVLEELVGAAVTENPYNSFQLLESLCVRNAFPEDLSSNECSLDFLADLHALRGLHSLQLHSKNGFRADPSTVDLLSHVFARMQLRTLHLTSLKGFASEDFVFLRSLSSLRHLEIGSCGQWFAVEDIEDSNSCLSGAFQYLSELTSLSTLRLIDITIDDCSQPLVKSLHALRELNALSIDNLRVEESGGDVLRAFGLELRDLPIETLRVSTADPTTNKLCLNLLKTLDVSGLRINWTVHVLVEDSGECFVPFARDDDCAEEADTEGGAEVAAGDRALRYMDLTFLNELLQSELALSTIEITPQ